VSGYIDLYKSKKTENIRCFREASIERGSWFLLLKTFEG